MAQEPEQLSREVWDKFHVAPDDNPADPKPVSLGWILGSMALVLVLVIGLVAYMAILRSENAMSDLLGEKGSSLLKVFESALRTGMRGDVGLQLQGLLEEMTKTQDIEFVAVTMPDGVIVAHSDRSRIGELFHLEGRDITSEDMERLAPDKDEQSRFALAEGKRVFLLYRHFTLGHKDWAKDVPEPTIFLGLDASPFEITRGQNRSYISIISLVMLLIGMTCLLALSFAQRAAESRRSQRRAENEVMRLEGEVRQKEKLAALGTLAAGVAHEIRNPLSSIKGYATYFRQRFPEGSEDREAASVMVREVDRLNRVITDLLGLSKPGDVQLKPVVLPNVARHVLKLIRQNCAERGVRTRLALAPEVPEVMADMERLSQALLNLCLNALDAMSAGGELTVAVSGGKTHVCVLVRDTGAGIAPEIMARIFDPYFTTKGSGTGLGLPMAHKIVTAHGGRLLARSHTKGPSRGTIFCIRLNIQGGAGSQGASGRTRGKGSSLKSV